MERVKVENSCLLSSLGRSVGEIKGEMQKKLNELNRAFEIACESWKDRNAQTCSKALKEHDAAMREAFEKLEDFENALNRLSNLASDYKNI